MPRKVNYAAYQELGPSLNVKINSAAYALDVLLRNQLSPEKMDATNQKILDLQEVISDFVLRIKGEFTKPDLLINRQYAFLLYQLFGGVAHPLHMLLARMAPSMLRLKETLTEENFTKLWSCFLSLQKLSQEISITLFNNFSQSQQRRDKLRRAERQVPSEIVLFSTNSSAPNKRIDYDATAYYWLLEGGSFHLGEAYRLLENYPKATQYYSEALHYLEGNTASAVKQAAKLRERRQRSSELYERLALVASKSGVFYALEQYLEKLISIHESSVVIGHWYTRSTQAHLLFEPIIAKHTQLKDFYMALQWNAKAQAYFTSVLKYAKLTDHTIKTYKETLASLKSRALVLKRLHIHAINTMLKEYQTSERYEVKVENETIEICFAKPIKTSTLRGAIKSFSSYDLTEKGLTIQELQNIKPRALSGLLQCIDSIETETNNTISSSSAEINLSPVNTSSAPVQRASSPESTSPEVKRKPKVKTRGKQLQNSSATSPAVIPKQLTSHQIRFFQEPPPSNSPYPLHRLSSRALAKGPFAYLDVETIKQQSKAADIAKILSLAKSLLQRGKIVPKHGEQGIKQSHKESPDYPFKLKFMQALFSKVRIYGHYVGHISNEGFEVPVIAFDQLVMKAH